MRTETDETLQSFDVTPYVRLRRMRVICMTPDNARDNCVDTGRDSAADDDSRCHAAGIPHHSFSHARFAKDEQLPRWRSRPQPFLSATGHVCINGDAVDSSATGLTPSLGFPN